MSFASYIRRSLIDMVLCLCASSALCYVSLIAFLSTLPLQAQPALIVGLCAAVTIALFAIAYNLRTALVGGVLLAIGTVAAMAVSWTSSGASSLFDDVAGNNVYLVIEVVASCVMTFLLSRRKVTGIVLLVGGLLLCCAMEYLYWKGNFVPTALFGVSAAALVALQNYRAGLKGSDAGQLMFGSTAAVAGALGCVSVLLAFGIFTAFIAPLDPPNLVIKLITRHVQLQEVEMRGTGDEVSIISQLLQSLNMLGTTESPAGSDQQNDQQDETDQDEEQQDEQDQSTGGSSFGLDAPSDDEVAEAVAMTVPTYVPILGALGIILLVALVIAARKMLRKRRYNRIRALPGDDQASAFYLYFTNAFSKMKIARPESATLREYMDSTSGVFTHFEGADEPEFAALTDMYSGSTYGAAPLTEEDVAAFDDYYRKFHRRAREYVGRLKYVPLFFRI